MKNKWTDDAVLAEGRKYSSRTQFATCSPSAYKVARKRGLLDQLYPSFWRDWSNDDDVLAEGRKYGSRNEFDLGSPGAYAAARKRGLLDQLYPDTKHANWSNDDEAVLAEGRKYGSRKEFAKGSSGAYEAARKRKLLDQLYPSKRTNWTDDAVLAEGRKYGSRGEFQQGSRSAYNKALNRNLFDQMPWLEDSIASDNDAIYIWRAVGQHYNGHPVYKIGVTSARLGTHRIKCVARSAGFEFDLICCEKVQGKATELERKLHLLGEDPKFVGFSGYTEFRALSDSALYAAISMICTQL